MVFHFLNVYFLFGSTKTGSVGIEQLVAKQTRHGPVAPGSCLSLPERPGARAPRHPRRARPARGVSHSAERCDLDPMVAMVGPKAFLKKSINKQIENIRNIDQQKHVKKKNKNI